MEIAFNMELDYTKLGFKCGIEIHQQLDTKKLFCNCSSIVHDTKPDLIVRRKLTAVAGETGSIDNAAAYEKSKDKEFIYEACSTSCCLVELDEEPPHNVNQDALKIVLEVSLLLNATIVDEIQFMRKTVIDGSNVSGFQRTALVAQDGYIETSKGKVIIESICLEEEAAKKIETTKEYARYRLDRLGIPLIEIATDASIKDPEHAKEVSQKLGMILRSTGKVKRGLGTIRQDVNVSIKQGVRTEIKGFQDLKSIPKVINYEVERQLKEIKNSKKSRTRFY
jgi:glutamyl-tRNA(Gln) amidotransferase subunit E